MRFYEDGPAIPDILLERRDEGRVVFLCGAGVSKPSGLPDFVGLTEHVIESLHPPENSEVKKAFKPWKKKSKKPKVPLDQIYMMLHKEYGQNEVNSLISKKLLESKNEKSVCHDWIKRISSARNGNPQIVTTNVDRLFEKNEQNDLPTYVPPNLPDLVIGSSIHGVTYLHGRIPDSNSQHPQYVFSSADFGRAYLSEAWATNFIRNLLEKYTVVLLGYKAEDPPVNYLLLGLNHDGEYDRSRLFAFDKGRPEDIETKWQDRGVTPIPYSCHELLWKTIKAWAARADNPCEWRKTIISKAVQDPKTLSPHERGQVVHVLRSAKGTRIFSKFDPQPHPEWICVLDANVRSPLQNGAIGQSPEPFDPRIAYGLDDEPKKQQRENFLIWNPSDENPAQCHNLGSQQATGYEELPKRLFNILIWITKSIESPVMAWWASQQNGLHPRLINQLEREVSLNQSLHKNARQVWNLILENQQRHRDLNLVGNNLKNRIAMEGWTNGTIREFRKVSRPHIVIISNPQPPSKEWEDIELEDIGQFKVCFMNFDLDDLAVPDEILLDVTDIIIDSVYLASGLLINIGTGYWKTPTCYPDREMKGHEQPYPKDAAKVFTLLKNLFDKIAILCPEQAMVRAFAWRIEDRFFFRKLKLYALSKTKQFNAEQVASTLLSLRQDIFWDLSVVRELLFLIVDRWSEFSMENRKLLAERILEGPDPHPHLLDEKDVKIYAAKYARYLELNGCNLPNDSKERLSNIIGEIPNWSDCWTRSMVIGGGSYFGSVKLDSSAVEILDLPIAEIIPKTREIIEACNRESFIEKDPFQGLVKEHPQKALDALMFEGKKGNFPQLFWSDLISYLPMDISPQLRRDFLHSIKKLPKYEIVKLKGALGQFLEDKLKLSIEFDNELGWSVYDHIVEGILSGGENALKSRMGGVVSGGIIIKSSRRTLDHALNSPMGECTKALFSVIPQHSKEGTVLPDCIKSRIEQLLNIQGEGSDHVISICMWKLNLLMNIDPEWVKEIFIPMLDLQHSASEPAWNGLLQGEFPSPKLMQILKPYLLDLIPTIEGFTWGQCHAITVAERLGYMNIFKPGQPDGLTNNEMRTELRNMSNVTRNGFINWLGRVGIDNDNGWTNLVVPFINDIWPKEINLRTSTSVMKWVYLLGRTDASFPEVFKAVKEFLKPVEMDAWPLYSFTEGNYPIVVRFPEQMLGLIDTITLMNHPQPLYFSKVRDILNTIVDTKPELKLDSGYRKLIDQIERNDKM